MSAAAELSVILVNFNDRPHLGACLESVRLAVEGLSAEVLLVDNHSEDGSPALVRQSYAWVRLLANDHNAGYAKGNNAGIRASTGRFLLFLNTDTIVPPDSLAALLAELKRRPQAGAIGPALAREGSGYQVSFGTDIGFFAELRQKLFLNPFYRMTLRYYRRVRSVGWLSGACLLARRDAVEAAGLFDENFFIYFEDIDLCRRIRGLGFELIYDPAVKVIHLGGAATSRRKWRSRVYYRESQLHYYDKHGSGLSVFLLRNYVRFSLVGMKLFRVLTEEDRMILRDAERRISGRR